MCIGGGVQPQILHPQNQLEILKEARGEMIFVLGSCSGDLCLGLIVYILMVKLRD